MLSLLIPNHVSEESEETNSSFSGFYHGVWLEDSQIYLMPFHDLGYCNA